MMGISWPSGCETAICPQKAHKLLAGVPARRLGQDRLAAGLKGGVKRQRAVTVVFRPVGFRSAQ